MIDYCVIPVVVTAAAFQLFVSVLHRVDQGLAPSLVRAYILKPCLIYLPIQQRRLDLE